MKTLTRVLLTGLTAAVLFVSPRAEAQSRDEGWDTATTVTSIAAGVGALVMPRVFYSSPEATMGWRARWHVSVLAPVMTDLSLTLLNEAVLKEAFADPGPTGDAFGLFSTQTMGSTQALGQGLTVFLIDTFKYNDGRFHFGSFAGHVLFPLTMTGITAAGRAAGDLESGPQILGSLGVGLATGVVFGLMYGFMQEPECGYTGSLICW